MPGLRVLQTGDPPDLREDTLKGKVLNRCLPRAVAQVSVPSAAMLPTWVLAQNGWSTAASGVASHDALPIHGHFLVAITVLFLLVFAITIYTMAKHRKDTAPQGTACAGSRGGTVQWLWATVPFAILLYVDYVLIGSHYYR